VEEELTDVDGYTMGYLDCVLVLINRKVLQTVKFTAYSSDKPTVKPNKMVVVCFPMNMNINGRKE
jgi:hypothetical protein